VKLESISQFARRRHGIWTIREQTRHNIGRFEKSFGIPAQAATCTFQRGFVTDAGQDVVQRSRTRFREAHAVGCDNGYVEGRREIEQRVIVGFLVAQQVTLQLQADVRAAKYAYQLIDEPADAKSSRVERGTSD
jgi:hypothetical protein